MGTSLRLPESHSKNQKKKKNLHTLGGGVGPWDLCGKDSEESDTLVSFLVLCADVDVFHFTGAASFSQGVTLTAKMARTAEWN